MASLACDDAGRTNPCGVAVYVPRGASATMVDSIVPTPPSGATAYRTVAEPNSAYGPSGVTDTQWGKHAAPAFVAVDTRYSDRNTPCGSLSPGTGGWTAADPTAGPNVIHGFLVHITDAPTNPGIYLHASEYATYLGNAYTFPSNTTLWQASWYDTVPDCSKVATDWANNALGLGLGGLTASWGQCSGTPDYDIGG